MAMDLKTGMVRLNFHNYDLWKDRTKQVLIREGLWRVIANDLPQKESRSESWIDKDERAAATIGYLVENSQLQLIRNAGTAQETWNILRDYHVRQSSAGRVGLVKRLCRLEMEETGDLEEHMITMDALFDKLVEMGCEISEEMKCSFIMASLPESYDNVVTMMEGQEGKFTERMVKAKLLAEYYKRQQRVSMQEESVMKATSSKGRKTIREYGDRYEEQRTCFECGKVGHIKKNCYRYLSRLAKEQGIDRESALRDNARYARREETGGHSVCFSATSESTNGGWIIDSGASHHMTSDISFFSQLQRKKSESYLADGKAIQILGVGEGTIQGMDLTGNVITVKLRNVLFVPDLRNSLISVRRVVESGARVEFGAGECCISKAGRIMLVGCVSSGVYSLKTADKDDRIRARK